MTVTLTMDHDETKSWQQPQSPDLNGTSSKTPDTLVVPGMQPLKDRIKTAEFATRPGFWEELRKPAKLVVTFLVPVAVVITRKTRGVWATDRYLCFGGYFVLFAQWSTAGKW